MSLPQASCTVVIPCHNGEPCLEDAVRSVQAQTFRDHHLVLVDDASTDGTLALARRLAAGDPRVTVLALPENRGRSAARNRGAEATRGPYLAFLDQDDAYHPNFLQATTEVLDRRADLDAVKVLPHLTTEIDPVRYETVANTLATTMLVRRTAFTFVGGWPEGRVYREHPGGCEDIALQDLLSWCFNLGVLHEKLYRYTHRPGNALDRFLARSRVVGGRVVFHGGLEEDRLAAAEGRRLRELLRQRVRDFLVERLGAGEAYYPPSLRPPGFARLENPASL
jgi:glycosyltransferase involved in cell wall biosynthesis